MQYDRIISYVLSRYDDLSICGVGILFRNRYTVIGSPNNDDVILLFSDNGQYLL